MDRTGRSQQQGKLKSSPKIETVIDDEPKQNRLIITDRETRIPFLIDTGADISVVPNTRRRHCTPTAYKLYAANGSTINTYGNKAIIVSLGLRRQFPWKFLMADVSKAIIGADFLKHYNLLVDLNRRRLVDPNTTLFNTGTLIKLKTPTISTIDSSHKYQTLLKEFPEITKAQNTAAPEQEVCHYITTRGPPIAEKARRLPPDKLEAAKREFQWMLKENIVQPSKSQWASPVHLVRKKSGEWRVCGDYRRLNNITIPDKYPLPHIQDIVQDFRNAKVFTVIDLMRAYHQIPLSEEDRPKTAVITPFGLYEYRVMPFGLCNAAQTFQRKMDSVLRDLDFCRCYIDDIIVASKDAQEHELHLRTLFRRLREHGLTINVNKCQFAKDTVKYLGCNVSNEGVSPLDERVKTIREYPKPRTIKDLKRFLGIINFYRRFLPKAGEAQIPLNQMTVGYQKRDKKVIRWTSAAEEAFRLCKEQMANAVSLQYPRPEAQLALKTDASDTAIGAVLEQCNNGAWEPLGFFSRKLERAQQKYSTYDRELLAVYKGLKYFRHWAEGKNLTIKTDHKPLVYAFQQKADKATPRQQRYLDFIGQYTTHIEYIRGKNNIIADSLSRIEALDLPVLVSTDEIALEQERDQELQDILKEPTALNKWNLQRIHVDGTNMQIYCDKYNNSIRPYIPLALRRRIFNAVHNLSHPSGRNTRRTICKSFVWPHMKKQIAEWARTCLACQRSKIQRHIRKDPKNIEIPPGRFDHIHIDIVGPLPPSKGFRYCLTIIDRFTRWPEAVPVAEISADSIATAVYSTWIARFGTPLTITTDQGTQFESQLFTSLTRLLGCNKIRTTAYHPAANGMIERWHRSLKAAITCHNNPEWAEVLPTVLLGLRTSYKEDIKATAAEMLYGAAIRLPCEFLSQNYLEDCTEPENFINKFRQYIQQIKPVPTAHHGKRKVFVHRSIYECTHVFLRVDGQKRPLESPYEGPFEVLDRLSDDVFRINYKGKPNNVTIERLKPAFIEATDDQNRVTPKTYVRKAVRFAV